MPCGVAGEKKKWLRYAKPLLSKVSGRHLVLAIIINSIYQLGNRGTGEVN